MVANGNPNVENCLDRVQGLGIRVSEFRFLRLRDLGFRGVGVQESLPFKKSAKKQSGVEAICLLVHLSPPPETVYLGGAHLFWNVLLA